jgi:hypothetical protein
MRNVRTPSGLRDDATYLTIKTRCRLVEEEEQLWLRSKFNTDGEKLALLNVQALAGHTDHCASELGHIEHLNDLLDIVILLFLADVLGLPQHCTEAKRLSHGSSLEMQIPVAISAISSSMRWEVLTVAVHSQ